MSIYAYKDLPTFNYFASERRILTSVYAGMCKSRLLSSFFFFFTHKWPMSQSTHDSRMTDSCAGVLNSTVLTDHLEAPPPTFRFVLNLQSG